MGWLSDTWSDIKDTASSAWDSTKDAVKDVTGIDSLNDAFLTGFGLQSGLGALEGRGLLGSALQSVTGPLMGQQMPPGGMPQMTGPLMGAAPASLTMGTGGQPAPQVQQPSAQDLAGLFGETGYQYGPSQTSTALLQSNPEAYQYQPLMRGIS